MKNTDNDAKESEARVPKEEIQIKSKKFFTLEWKLARIIAYCLKESQKTIM